MCRVSNGYVENLCNNSNVAAFKVQKEDTIESIIMRAAIC